MLDEAFAYHEKNLRTRPQGFGELTRDRFRIGGLFTLADYVQAQRVRSLLKREFATFEGFDPISRMRGPSFTSPFNMTGLPAISIPCGFTAAGRRQWTQSQEP